VKGDTVEYIADSFKVRDNATVEALLKKLPGIQVSKDGQIMAYGEKVQKVLVDGEEFFTDDPAVVTKSLQAKAIDKVQVFDKKSDQAVFTGIDDGEKTKTINLQLKEDKKKGYFGKVIAGGGAGDEQGYFENQAMFNAFKSKRKFSAFGIMSNTGKMGLGWEDRDKFGGGSGENSFVDENGGFVTYYNSSDDNGFEGWNGQYNGQGFPRAWTAGTHYSNKWGKDDKYHIGGNYRYAKQDMATTTNTLNENFLPNNKKQVSNQQKENYSVGQRHRVDGIYEWKLDTTSNIKLTANAGYSNTKTNSTFESSTKDGNDSMINSTKSIVSNDATTKSINSVLDWRKRFKKKGRTIGLNISENYRETESNGFQNFNNKYFIRDTASGKLLTTTSSLIDQKKINENKTLSLSAKLNYTEPLSKVAFLDAAYTFKVDNTTSLKETFNKQTPTDNDYQALDSVFSNDYMFNIQTHTGAASVRFMMKKINFSLGGSAANASFLQEDLIRDTSRRYNFTNFFPKAYFTYNFNKQRRLRFDYNGYTRQPSIDQIQPLRNNSTPNNIAIGNANLTQEFTQSVGLSFNDYKMLSNRYIWMNANFDFTDNAISRSETIDATGQRVYQYINVDGNHGGWGYVGIGRKITKINLDAGVYGSLNIRKVNSVINNIITRSDNNRYSLGMRFGYQSEGEKIEINYNPEYSYNDNRSSVNTQTTSFYTFENEFSISFKLPLKFEAGTDADWFIRQKTSVFDQNNNVFKWNAYVAKKLLKNDVLELRLSVFDILNQNLGFSRYAQNNIITQDKYNTIRRYGMLTLTWNFTKAAAGVAPQNAATQIIQMVK
jgi:hypothetical protein